MQRDAFKMLNKNGKGMHYGEHVLVFVWTCIISYDKRWEILLYSQSMLSQTCEIVLKSPMIHGVNKAMTDIRMFEYLPKLFTISNIRTWFLPLNIWYFYQRLIIPYFYFPSATNCQDLWGIWHTFTWNFLKQKLFL